ncbi:probable allantoinase [Amborella trichopoda]|uniref:probable allantoinase n=1 Tax=Amborella trichopoda TaxID=13333 RepID=UPI0009BE1CD1|nr:probable allantoinase [Amborella trichopoda]XP_020524580.1 probable allantoinase [Amborella trichopoda]|eukprot:XP_011625481.2 probable allantoinase [Amborella trichopoda]
MDLLRSWALPLLSVMSAFLIIFYTQTFSKPTGGECSLLPHDHFWISSQRIVTPGGVSAGAVEVRDGKIISVVQRPQDGAIFKEPMIDYGEAVIMPGLVDVHAHLDEPGRAEWEGFATGTRAAAAGGITTLIDMPLNSFPTTTTEEALQLKVEAAQAKIYVDVGFWGGLVPENAFNATALDGLLKAGVLGLKSFMCPSGIADFPMTNTSHIKEALPILARYRRPLLVHAEIQPDQSESGSEKRPQHNMDDPRSYSTYLKTRPPSWEEAAIRELSMVAEDTRENGLAQGGHLHIVHLSDARVSLDIIKEAKRNGASLTVETCPHYLAFAAEEIQSGDTRFKCAPPIREEANRKILWEALKEGHIDMLSSDHSPSVPELKLLDEGDFLRAWGGISSLQFVLPATWSYGREHGIALDQLASWWSTRPAKLAGQEFKGAIAKGNDADIVVWDPDIDFTLDENYNIYHKHPVTPYMGKQMHGKVLATFVRGNLVYREGEHAPAACGIPILAK